MKLFTLESRQRKMNIIIIGIYKKIKILKENITKYVAVRKIFLNKT